MIVLPFAARHLFALTSDQLALGSVELYERGDAWTQFAPSGVPVAAAGVMELWPGVGEAWLFTSPRWNGRAVARHVRQYLDVQQRFRRVQASVAADDNVALRFALWAGLRAEGRMPMFGPDGRDFIRFARLYR